jgi:hypothetical protein
MSIVLYPLRRGVLVTGDRFQVHDREFEVTELAEPGWCRGSGQEARRTALRVLAVETGLVVAALALGTMIAGPSPAAVGVGVLNLVVAALLVRASAARWPDRLELWAEYRGVPTLLHSSTDHTEFHQVCRALQRALELNRYPLR